MTSRYWLAVAAVAAVAFIWGRPLVGGAQSTGDVEKRLAAMEASQKAILKELQDIKTMLQGRPNPVPQVNRVPAAPPAPVPLPTFDLEIAGSASKGRADAPLTLIEFSEFECPFCGRFARDTFGQIEREYINTGKLRYVFRHFPLSIHQKAVKAAEAAECARSQGKFWEMHDRLFANQQLIGPNDLFQHAQALGLNSSAFQQCLVGQTSARVRQDANEGGRAGITGTPTFFIGRVTKEGKLKVLAKLTGAKTFALFKTTLDDLLASPGTQ